MKKFFISFLVCLSLSTSVFAENFPPLKYKNIGNKDKISYNADNDKWSNKIDKKSGSYFIKTKGFGNFYDYLFPNKDFAFTTECEYEFLYKNNLIGFSNRNLKFYNITFANGEISKRELSKEEVQEIFSDYNVILLSEFSQKTNSLKIKKHIGDLKILLLNDSDKTFDKYIFSSGNASFTQYSLRGFISVSKAGMIQFSAPNESDSWYVLLVR